MKKRRGQGARCAGDDQGEGLAEGDCLAEIHLCHPAGTIPICQDGNAGKELEFLSQRNVGVLAHQPNATRFVIENEQQPIA